MKRKLIHYRMSSYLMIIGNVIAFICFFNCMNLYHLLATEYKEKDEYSYKDVSACTYVNMGEKVSLGNVLHAEQGIVCARDIMLYRDTPGVNGTADVITSQNEELSYPIIEGSIPKDDSELTEPTVILGRRQLEDTIIEDGRRYFVLEGEKCFVCAVTGSSGSDVFDYKVLLYYSGLGDGLRSIIDAQDNVQFVIESNNVETKNILADMKKHIQKQTENIAIGGGGMVDDRDGIGLDKDTREYVLIFMFCAVNVIFVSEYWVKRRFREVAVRRIFGYSNVKIYMHLYKDMVLNVMIAAIIAVIIQAFLQAVFHEYLYIYSSQLIYYIFYSILFVFIVSGIFMIYPFVLLKNQENVKALINRY